MSYFHIVTLGCKVNQCESESLVRQLARDGYRTTDDPAQADIFIINTCAVTSRAAMQSRQVVRRLLRQQPGARVVVTGCSVQTDLEAFEAIEGVTDFIGNADKDAIPSILTGAQAPASIQAWREIHPVPALKLHALDPESSRPSPEGRTRAFFKIQDGCDSFCTYCIVPHARGPVRSLSLEEVLDGLGQYGESGYREVVLTGIHLGKWGRDLNPPRKLEHVLAHIPARRSPARVRLSSIEPNELSDGIIQQVAGWPGFARHFHIPLQSGDNGVLSRMGRPYTREQFRERIEKIRRVLPEAGIGADVMVGFPGEDENAFQQTCDLLRILPVTYLHVFPFSPRLGTPASELKGQVNAGERKKRAAYLRRLGQTKHREFLGTLVGQTVEVLVIGASSRLPQMMEGLASNYAKIRFPGGAGLRNRFVSLNVLDLDAGDWLAGELA